MDNVQAALTELVRLQAALTYDGESIVHVYRTPPDRGKDLPPGNVWMNANRRIAGPVSMLAGLIQYDITVDSTLFLPPGTEQSTWKALGWWDAWLRVIGQNPQLAGTVIQVTIQANGALDGTATWNGKTHVVLAMAHRLTFAVSP